MFIRPDKTNEIYYVILSHEGPFRAMIEGTLHCN